MEYQDSRMQEMYDWFHANFIPPEACVPRLSQELGYQYICGGPYFADELLKSEFGQKYPEDVLSKVIMDIEAEGTEWARAKHYDYS